MVDKLQWFQAAEEGDLALIQQGINDKIDVNCQDSKRRTAVYLAAAKGHVQLMEYLISQQADLHIADEYGFSPLHIAALTGHEAVVELLLSHGANVNQIDSDGWSPLHQAAIKGHEAVVAVLLSHGANVNQIDSDGSSPLHQAAVIGNEAVVELLLSKGADVNQADNKRQKPIDIAKTQKIKFMLIAHTKKQQKKQQPDPSSVPVQAVNEPDQHALQGLAASSDAQSSRQRELQELSEGEVKKLGNDLIDICRRVEILADNASPMEFNKCVDRIAAMKKDLDAFSERAEVVSSRGALLGEGIDGDALLQTMHRRFMDDMVVMKSRLEEARTQLEPLDRLWSGVKSYVDKTRIWQESPLSEIDPKEAERTAGELYHIMQQLGEEFTKMGEKRQNPKNFAERMQDEWKDFIEGSVPLMLLICNPGMKERHWEDIEKVTGLQMPKHRPLTVSMMTEIGLQNYLKEIADICVSAREGHRLEVENNLMALLLDEFIAACVEEDVPTALMQLAMEKGEKPWGRSTVMFVGAGRAGKTGTERSMLGYAFEHTESTVGINNEYMFEVTSALANVDGDANFADGSRWLLAEKAEKEYESALAKLASAIQQGKVDKVNLLEQKVEEQKAKMEALKKDLAKADAAGIVAPSVYALLSSVPSPSSSSSQAAQPAVRSPVAVAPAAAAGGGGGGVGGDDGTFDSLINNDPLSPPSTIDPQEVDLEYALRMLAKDLQMNSKLLLTFLDFGGQKAFESINQFFMVKQGVYVVVMNMECFLTPDRVPINPEKGITTWSECLKVLLHWLNTVVVHTMSPGSTKPAPIFIVGTHKDTVPSSADHQAISEALSAALGVDNPVLNSLQRNEAEGLCFFPIDNTLGRSDATMTTLMKRIEAVIETQEYVHKMLPLLWFRVLDWLNGQSRHYLMYDEVARYAKECGFDMSTTQAVDDMLSMFHECSVLMWHNVDGLRHIVILNPIGFFVAHATNLLRQHTATATDATKHKLPPSIVDKIQSDTMLRSDFKQMVSTGILTRRLLDVLLSEAEEPRVVVQLMVTYALLVPLRREEAEVNGGGDDDDATLLLRYLVPALLPEGTNDVAGNAEGEGEEGHRFFVFFTVTGLISDDCLRHGDMRAKGFLPGGLFARLVAKLLAWSQDTTTACTWSCDKDSMTLFFGAQKFHVTHRPDINSIQVSMFDRHTPLAIHARLKNILEVLIAECFHCLSMSTLVEHRGDGPIQGAVRPSSGIRWLVPLSAIRKLAVFLLSGSGGGGSQGVRRLTAKEVETWFDAWIVRTSASDVEQYDVFISHRWDWPPIYDKPFVRKLADLLAQFTIGDNPPRAILTFLDVDALEDGLNFQEAFVGGLVRSRVMVVVVSWAALDRMINLDPTREDNVLVEWLCAMRLLHLKRIHVMPVFFGKRTDANGVGGSFFEVDAITKTTVLQRLPDVVAEATLTKAVELMTKAGVWTSGSPVEPSAFGLSSLSVRAIVTAMTGQLGIQACDSKNPAELLRSCAVKITAILAKSTAAGATDVAGASGVVPNMATVRPFTPIGAAPSSGGDFASGGGMSPLAVLDVSGAMADQQIKSEEAMFQWLLTHTPGIVADAAHTYVKAFAGAKILTMPRLAKKIGKEPGFLLSLGVDEDDADDIVQAMRDERMLTAQQ